MSNYIQKVQGYFQKERGYSSTGIELVVIVSFEAKQFNQFKKSQNPIAHVIPQIKNVVYEATGVLGVPLVARHSYKYQWPRASQGIIKIQMTFTVSNQFVLNRFKLDPLTFWGTQPVDLNSVFESTKNEGHLFARTALLNNIRKLG